MHFDWRFFERCLGVRAVSNMQKETLILALRLFSKDHARTGIEKSENGGARGRLIDRDVDRLYPALKNIINFHYREGSLQSSCSGDMLSRERDGSIVVDRKKDCLLCWCEIETCLPETFWESRHEVEVVLKKSELESFASSIRSKRGVEYIDACEEFARSISILPVKIRYIPPHMDRQYAA